jgi:hypothetical protein
MDTGRRRTWNKLVVVGIGPGTVSNVDGGADGAEADVGVDNLGVGNTALDLAGNAGVFGARTTITAGLALLLRGVGGVEPEHVGVVLEVTMVSFVRGFFFFFVASGLLETELTSSQMDMTRTIGTARAALSWSKPPTSPNRGPPCKIRE